MKRTKQVQSGRASAYGSVNDVGRARGSSTGEEGSSLLHRHDGGARVRGNASRSTSITLRFCTCPTTRPSSRVENTGSETLPCPRDNTGRQDQHLLLSTTAQHRRHRDDSPQQAPPPVSHRADQHLQRLRDTLAAVWRHPWCNKCTNFVMKCGHDAE